MKTFVQLGQAAYQAYCKRYGHIPSVNHPTWDQLEELSRQGWIAAAKQVAAEIAAIH